MKRIPLIKFLGPRTFKKPSSTVLKPLKKEGNVIYYSDIKELPQKYQTYFSPEEIESIQVMILFVNR